jgi:hypothetical protein
METEALYFTTDFNWLTDFIRSLWSEGSFRRALDVLNDLGIPQHESFEIIRGNLKMIQDPDGVKGIDGQTAKDNWKPNLALCDHSRYPDPDELYAIEKERDIYAKKYIDQCVTQLNELLKDMSIALERGVGKDLSQYYDLINTFPDNAFEIAGIKKNDYFSMLDKIKSLYIQQEREGKKLEEYVDHQIELDSKELPEVDSEFKFLYGWLLPDGKFYPCDWLDHIWLASKLGKSEEEAENSGWIKFTQSGIWHVAKDKPTQRQIDAVFSWCNNHERMDYWNKFIEENK